MSSLYTAAERASAPTKFPSHDYGMVGVVKQLIDAQTIDVINRLPPGTKGQIERITVYPSQAFIWRGLARDSDETGSA